MLHHILCTELSTELPPNYDVGYFKGRNHSKRWLTNDQDLKVMNEKFTSGDVYLWCNAQQSDSHCENRAFSHDSSDRNRSPEKKNLQKGMKRR